MMFWRQAEPAHPATETRSNESKFCRNTTIWGKLPLALGYIQFRPPTTDSACLVRIFDRFSRIFKNLIFDLKMKYIIFFSIFIKIKTLKSGRISEPSQLNPLQGAGIECTPKFCILPKGNFALSPQGVKCTLAWISFIKALYFDEMLWNSTKIQLKFN